VFNFFPICSHPSTYYEVRYIERGGSSTNEKGLRAQANRASLTINIIKWADDKKLDDFTIPICIIYVRPLTTVKKKKECNMAYSKTQFDMF